MTYLIVFFGGGIGAALRHGVNIASARYFGTAFPFATMIENVSGSLLMGLLVGYFAFRSGGGHQHWQLFLTTGILGGYTTFSAFSLDAVLLYERGALGLAALYVLGSVLLAIAGLVAGLGPRTADILIQNCRRAKAHTIGLRPSRSNRRISRSRPGLGVVRSFGP